MIRIAICDDEQKERDYLSSLLNEYLQETIEYDVFPSGMTLLAAKKNYDIILLDIDMQEMDGMRTAKHIREYDKDVKLIYITNYSDYTFFAFGVHAFAYLLKPVSKKELFEQIYEASSYGYRDVGREVEFQTKEGVLKTAVSEVLFFEYIDREICIHTKTKEYYMKQKIGELAETMKEFDFVMPHKSFIVNLDAVKRINGYDLLLTDGSILPLSQKKSVEFRRMLNEFLAKRIIC